MSRCGAATCDENLIKRVEVTAIRLYKRRELSGLHTDTSIVSSPADCQDEEAKCRFDMLG